MLKLTLQYNKRTACYSFMNLLHIDLFDVLGSSEQ